MVQSNYSEDFKRDAVHPLSGSGLPANHEKNITVRGYPVREVSRRLGVSTHSLYKWLKLFAVPASKAVSVDHEAENRRLKRELARMTEERDILKMDETIVRHWSEDNGRMRTSRRIQSEVRVCSLPGRVLRSNAREGPTIIACFRCARCVGASASIPVGSMHGLKSR